jgi:PAS domain S-box-containing protein
MSTAYRVLLISSDETLTRAVRDAAEGLPRGGGHQLTVSAASRLAEGLGRALSGDHDVLVLDVGTTGATRSEAMRNAFATASGLPVVVLSGDDGVDSSLEWLDQGAVDVLTPATLDSISLYRSVAAGVRVGRLQTELDQWRVTAETIKERFRAVFDIAGDGILVVDRNGVIQYLNPAAEQLFDRRREELEGLSLGLPQVSGTTTDIEIVTRSGGVRVVEMRIVDTRWDGRDAVLATLREVTERVRAHTTLVDAKAEVEASAQRMDEILSSVPHAVLLLDDDRRVLYANTACETILGTSTTALIGRVIDDVTEPIPRGLASMVRRASASSTVVEDRMEFAHAEHPRLLAAIAMPLERTFDGAHGVLVSVRDITASTEAESRYRALFDEAGLGVAVTTVTGEVREANPRMRRMLGIADGPLEASHLMRTVSDEDRDLLVALIESAGQRTPTIRFTPSDTEQVRWGQVAVSAILEGAGEARIVVIHDVTEQKQLEEQLLQAQKIEALGQLAGGVAHDFNNLLMAMMGYVDLMLLELEETAPLRRFATGIQETIERSASLTRQLLAFSRSQRLDPRVIEVDDAVASLKSMFTRLIDEHIRLEFRLQADGALVRVDPGQLSQVITNLVINARDAMPQGGHLIIETARVTLDEISGGEDVATAPNGYAMIAVSDTGVGMDEATRLKVFEPFFTTKDAGTGLGLSTSYGIVNQSGGRIFVYSEPGRGATFKVYLPIAGPGADDSTEAATGRSIDGAGKTILVAEDDNTLRTLVCDALARVGFQVLEAANGDDALDLYRQNPDGIDLVLADVIMPGMGGRDLAAAIAVEHPGVRLVFMSGYTANGIVHHDVLSGTHPLLEKPFTRERLLDTLSAVLDDREVS